jgi:ankyrin repeat protein
MFRTIKPFAFLLIVMSVGGCGASLMELSQRGDIQGVQRALLRGSDVNATTRHGHTPLTLAAREGHLEVVQALIQAGADLEARAWRYIFVAQAEQYPRDPEYVREQFVNVDSSGPQSLFMAERTTRGDAIQVPIDGKTAMMFAAEMGHLEVVEALIRSDADVSAKSGRSGEHIYKPIRNRYQSFNRRLKRSNERKTAMDFAIENGHKDIVNLLIKADLRLLEVSNR